MSASDLPASITTARLVVEGAALVQPRAVPLRPVTLHVAIASLALGGAERIVLDWAARARSSYGIRIIVLRDTASEWPVPEGVDIARLHGNGIAAALEREGARIAASGHARVLCHLLRRAERDALARGGADPVAVIHNASSGWLEPASALRGESPPIAVSRAAADELHATGIDCRVTVIRHLPSPRRFAAQARHGWRRRWQIPENAFVVGMIGGIKPQKAYPRALRVLAGLLERRDAWLVIVGGPTGRDGLLAWNAVLSQAGSLGIAARLRLPGAIADAERCLPAFDVLLNTSRYEGLSIATLEALAAGIPVVASDVGGQREVESPGLSLLAFDTPDREWADAVDQAGRSRPAAPAWRSFPAWRQWTLAQLVAPRASSGRAASSNTSSESASASDALFVTANLNAGGAQRSLVNLAVELAGDVDLEILVCGNSTSAAFTNTLIEAGVRVHRTGDSRDCFDHAEAVVRRANDRGAAKIVFWSVDAKTRLLVAKALESAPVRLIDVSPGDHAFEEMRDTTAFQHWIAFDERAWYRRLDRLVMKHGGPPPESIRRRTVVIPNGVRIPRDCGIERTRGRRVVVSGRIAPTKYLLEIVEAMRILWRAHPDAELHVLGTAEPRHREYAAAFLESVGGELGRRVMLHGAAFDAPERLADFDVALVLGHHQGSPNAVLEAMAAGLPVVANDSGGTRELIRPGRTGILLRDRDPARVSDALSELLSRPSLASAMGRRGRRRASGRFSMSRMAKAYLRVLHH